MESNVMKLNNNKEDFKLTPNILNNYYKKYYPSELIIDWLTKKGKKNLKNREFCFTLENDKYIRYQSFKSSKEFEKRISKLNPIKIDIGGIYNQEPRNYIENKNNKNKIIELICQEKELVFDIDISDYDDVRKCCQNNDVCTKCWKYIISGAKILERILVEDFGFQKIFFVFSGRRGIHCWVCDERASILNKNARTAIEKYIYYERVKDNKDNNNNKIKRNFAEPVYPSFESAVSIIKNDFYDILKEQNLLNDEELKSIFKKIISLYFNVIDMDIINDILEKKNWNSSKKLKNIFELLEKGEKILKNKKNINYCSSEACLNEFMMYILYPRLDSNVTIQVSHLLKGPFCVHPKTGYISVPMSIELLEKFSFDKIPKVDYLIENENKSEENSFLKYLNYFKDFVNHINENSN
jgi:DNA primase small subunit